ncbi:MAG: DNA gyrase inhibitor YacG [Pseudomonadota bacterium]|nr:DNA gyrase inhibitor YacG [Pseudomonadota bacterium]
MISNSVPERIVRCPGCGGDSIYSSANAYRPFCSQRCKNVDFGAWASEGYRVEAPATSEDPDDLSPPTGH